MLKQVKLSVIINFAVLIVMSGCSGVSVKKEQAITVKETEKVESKYTGPKRRIAIADFENKTKYGARRLGTSASDILLTELAKSGKFILVEREQMNKILEEHKLAMSGVVDSASAVEAGKLLGVNALVTGSISQFGVKEEAMDAILVQTKQQIAQAVVDLRVIDVETGEIMYADSGKGEVKKKFGQTLGVGTKGGYDETIEGDALRAAIVKFVDNIISQVNKKPWSCLVAQTKNQDVFLNAGNGSGLKVGDKLKVFNLGDEITDPATGKVIGRDEQEIGMIQVNRFFGENGSVAKVVSGTMPSIGDICRLQEK
jgi:curli biogenesis system outer membrane secretion channel CsgG